MTAQSSFQSACADTRKYQTVSDDQCQRSDQLNEILTQLIRTRKSKTGGEKVSVTFRLIDPDKELLDLLAEDFGLSQGDFVSLALRFYTGDLIRLKEGLECLRVSKIKEALDRATSSPPSGPTYRIS